MRILLFLFITLVLSSCIQHTESNKQVVDVIKQFNVNIKYAEGFSIDCSHSDYTKIDINSIQSTFDFTDSIFLTHSPEFDPNGRKMIKENYQSLALQSSTYLAFLNILNKVDLVKGISGLQYVNSEYYNEKLANSNTKEISINGSIQMESLLSVNPELFLIFPFELDNKEKYEEKGIQTLLISEYLEETPLARLEWIKLFGLIFNESELAENYFSDVEEKYNHLVSPVDSNKTVFFNLPFKDNWNMPSSNSITANLVKDAGFNYIYSDTINDNSVRAKETVWNDAMTCEYWIIIASRPADFTLEDLKNEQDIYADFPAVKKGKVIFCNTSTTDYFTNGIVAPDQMLKDLIHAFNPVKSHVPQYFTPLK